MIERHREDTQTLYAELLALLLALEGQRSWSHLAGTFTAKTVAVGETSTSGTPPRREEA